MGMLFFSFFVFGREDAPDVRFLAILHLPLPLFVPIGRMLVASMFDENLSRVTLYVARLRPNGEKG
jgi:hypothetical protein